MLKLMFNAQKQKFVLDDGMEVNMAQGFGWMCVIRYDGSVRCVCYEVKDGKQYFETVLHITKGGRVRFSKFIKGVRNYDFTYLIKNWPVDGKFVLSDGPIKDRRAFFLEMNKISEEWNKKYGISEIKIENPNGIRFLEFCYFEEERYFCIEHIETDGKIEFIAEDFGATLALQEMYPGSNSFEHFEKLKVTGATWIIITTINTKKASRILYTTRDPLLLRNLPEGPKKITEEEK